MERTTTTVVSAKKDINTVREEVGDDHQGKGGLSYSLN